MQLLKTTDLKATCDVKDFLQEEIDKAKDKWSMTYDGIYPAGGIVVTTMRPFHMESGTAGSSGLPNYNHYNSWETVIDNAVTWENWINVTLDEKVWLVISGMFNRTLNPSLTELRIKATNVELAVQNIEEIYTWEEAKFYWSSAFAVQPERILQIQIYARRAQNELIGLLGNSILHTAIAVDQS